MLAPEKSRSTFLTLSRLASNPSILRVPFFLMFNFNRETPEQKGDKGSTGVPSKIYSPV